MSYWVNYYGSIDFGRELDEQEERAIGDIIDEGFGGLDYMGTCGHILEFGGYTRAEIEEESLTKAIMAVSVQVADVTGTVYCRGEDDELWRYVFADGKWDYEEGEIVYVKR